MALAVLVRVPLLGRLIKAMANRYARSHHGAFALTSAEAEEIVSRAEWVAVGHCACRRTFKNCSADVEAEIVVEFGDAVYARVPDNHREVSREEALGVLKRCRENRLVPMMMQCRGHYYAICNCCTCCCVPLRLKNRYGIDYAIIRRPGIVDDFFRQLARHRH